MVASSLSLVVLTEFEPKSGLKGLEIQHSLLWAS